ncbi:actin-depolymerizing factor 5-like isoform X2 [Rosa rugosa]|uniref:actin-depolymerizing factor 5-like isoform X2 n=1 Tax=Rosa rugosa TaxID=74645 RepID=UPI002B410FEB|nr:actin-depolymerizing factor 5-like isoform X2 [Rosa rugosa]
MAMAFKMATTGMWVTDECKNSFLEMKWKKVARYIVYKIDEESRLVTVDKVGGPGESYDDLAASLPKDDCRYAVFDFDFVTVDNCKKSKIFFIAWIQCIVKFGLLLFISGFSLQVNQGLEQKSCMQPPRMG